MPKRPTLAETVLPGFNSTRWIGLLAPAGTPSTPSEIVQKIATDLRQLMASEDLKPMFVELGVLPGLRG